ncbi:MAG TPA: DUF5946 family protein [Mycobacteriales bacterium]|nr:DUF5946 family protein [Mycobacteriales bacterium]
MNDAAACPGCGGRFAPGDGPTHPYMESSPGCWRVFGEVVAADYSSVARMTFHQVIVDAYAAQHPGAGDRRQVQSVGLHLMTLCLFLEHDVDPALGPELHRRMIDRPLFHRLPRTGPGELTVAHVPTHGRAEGVRRAAFEWATAVWTAYEPAHATVAEWLRVSGFDVGSSTGD